MAKIVIILNKQKMPKLRQPGLTHYNNLDTATYRYGAVSGKTDFHVDISKYPGGEFLFPR